METQSIDIKILIATHKHYQMPSDDIYLPVHVGAYGKESIGYTRDDDGDNISEKNKNYCELTGLYWAWKNTKSDYLGLVHYRRYFARRKLFSPLLQKQKWNRIIDGEYLRKVIEKSSSDNVIILPHKRNYFIETNYSQYIHAHHVEDLEVTRQILSEQYPEYLEAYEKVMSSTKGHRFNMFIMKRKLADEYCQWIFDILFELENRLDISNYSDYDKRVFGFISERLLDVWIEQNQYSYVELPAIYLEKRSWIKKIFLFVMRKINYQKREV